jgi:PKHD-type hydroxylase
MKRFILLNENNNLMNFHYYKKQFTDEEIEKIMDIAKNYKVMDGELHGGKVDVDYRNSKITWLPLNAETNFIYEKIIKLLKISNKAMWNFTITDVPLNLQLAEYTADTVHGKNGFYNWHADVGRDLSSTRKLSVSVQLSEPTEYEGGDLEFMINRSTKAPREKGTVILFPSYIIHKVNKVTKGTRRSLVLWFCGPPFV